MMKRMSALSALILAASGLAVQPLFAQSIPVPTPAVQTWDLPHGTAVKDAGPRTYRFTVDYDTANVTGEVVHRQRVTGDYTRGLANGDVEWNNVGEARWTAPRLLFPGRRNRTSSKASTIPSGPRTR